MTTFDTPRPISVTLEIAVGDIRIVASDRNDTVVEVRPSNAANQADVTAAAQTRVEFDAGRLLVKAPKRWRQYTPLYVQEAIDVLIELPTGSDVQGEGWVSEFRCAGRLGDIRFKVGVGKIRVDEARSAQLKTTGDIIVERVDSDAELNTGSGLVQVTSIGGSATVKNSNGDTWIGEAKGDLRVNSANGKISVDQAHATVVAKTANGDIRLSEVEYGSITAQTACGKVDIGILNGTAAWLDLKTGYGAVQSDMVAVGSSEPGEETVEVCARSSFGDITVRRATPAANDAGRA